MVEVSPAFRQRLRVLPSLIAIEVRPVIEAGAEELVQLMRTLVPVDDGDLKASIGWTWGSAPRGALVVDTVGPKGSGERVIIYAGGPKAPHARWVEFGTVPHSLQPNASVARGKRQEQGAGHPGARAQPFFWPAYRVLKSKIRRRINAAVKRGVKKANAR